MISVFTPSHNPKHLARTAESLRNQTYKVFEWVIVPNGGVSTEAISEILAATKMHGRIVPFAESKNIGAIKNFACSQCDGEILLELDHDDELTPDALEEVAKAFEDPKIDFVYSNFSDVKADGTPRTFSADFGWVSRPLPNGRIETVAFEPSPASFSKIWYCPNHLRAWRKEFYNRLGGHDKTLDVLDDHDLLCRTYINGTVKHIDKCLYVYHLHGENTCYAEKNTQIQEQTLAIHDQYIEALVLRWCDLTGLRKIDLCGAFGKPQGYESIDLSEQADITFDLEKANWPLPDGSVGVVRASDSLEHMKDPINTMKEIYRILAPGGWLLSNTPSTDGRGWAQDPTHKSYWNSNSFFYYTKINQAKYIGAPVRFQLNRIKNWLPSLWEQTHNITYVKADLVKIPNEGRLPGLIEI